MRDSVTLYEFLKKVLYLDEKRQVIFELIAIAKWILLLLFRIYFLICNVTEVIKDLLVVTSV